MENIKIDIPDVKFEKDFTIIYKGSDNNEIIEINTSRDEIMRKLRYFKKRANEIKFISEYYIHDEFQSKLFKEFLNTMETNKIEINANNYLEFYKMSQKYEYNELQESIEKFISTRPDLQIIISKLSVLDDKNSELNIDYEKEKIISKNLDFILQQGNLSKLPISSLNRIFNSPDRILHNHHLLFEFIKSKIENQIQIETDENSNDLSILIGSLDFNEMNLDEIVEIINLVEHNAKLKYFSPRNSNEFIKSLIQQNKNKDEEIESIRNELSIQNKIIEKQSQEQEELKAHISMLERKYEQVNQNIDEMRKEFAKYALVENISKIESKIDEQQTKNEIKHKEIEKKVSEKNVQQDELIQKIQQNIEQQSQKIIDQDKRISDIKEIPLLFHGNNEFEGIIKYFLNKSGGDIGKYINITSSSVENNQKLPQNAILFDDKNKYFASLNISNQWICFEFKEHQIIPTNYTIRSYHLPANNCHPKSWVIEGANVNNNDKWEILDEHNNSAVLNGPCISKTFSIQNKSHKSFRFIRMRETNSNWRNDKILCFNTIEFYGFVL